MILKFKKHLGKSLGFLENSRLLLAVSGGIDSMVMLHLFYKNGFDIAVAHCNFNLRGKESDGDEAFLRQFCESNKIPVFSSKFDTQKIAEDFKISIQLSARKIRYEWFQELAKEHQFDYILTAHNADDVAETFLINLSRGSGLDGFTGIPQINQNIVRPLLPFSRKEIENFAKENQIIWREDSSNASDKYIRNQLRHQVIPVLKNINANFLESFQQTIGNLQQAQSLVDDASRIVYRKVVRDDENQKIIHLDELLQLSNFRAYLYQWLSPFGFTAWEDIYDLVNAQSGKQVLAPHFRLIKNRNELMLVPAISNDADVVNINKNEKEVNFPIKLTISEVTDYSNSTNTTIFVDASKIQFPLTIRKWREGDYFYPFGMHGKRKKVSKFFKDEKFSLLQKEAVWLLCSANEIVWIIGYRPDDRYKIVKTTKHILKINYSK